MTPQPLTAESPIEEILHGLVLAGIFAASIFVKNPKSQAQAGNIINFVTSELLPIVDSLLNPPAKPAA